MDRTQVHVTHVFGCGVAIQLPVEGVSSLVDDDVARIDLHHRLYVLVPAIVARPGLFTERLGRVYADDVFSRHPSPPYSLLTRASILTEFGSAPILDKHTTAIMLMVEWANPLLVTAGGRR